MSEHPIFDAVQREFAGREAREFVRANLTPLPPIACPTCQARVGWPCYTAGGKPAKRPHVGRRA